MSRLPNLGIQESPSETASTPSDGTKHVAGIVLPAWAERRLGLALADPAALPLPPEAVVTVAKTADSPIAASPPVK